ADNGELAVFREDGRVIEAVAAGEEATDADVAVPGPRAVVERAAENHEAAALAVGLDVEDAAAPAHQGAGAAGFAGLLRREFGKVAAQRLGRAGAGAEQQGHGRKRNRA